MKEEFNVYLEDELFNEIEEAEFKRIEESIKLQKRADREKMLRDIGIVGTIAALPTLIIIGLVKEKLKKR